jgi:AraC-like DNA-binding protein
MKVDLIDILLIVIFFQLLSFIPFLLFNKGKRSLPNKILALFLLAKAICITNFLSFRQYDFFFQNFPHTFFLGSSFTLLWGPGLYFYTKSLLFKDFRFKKIQLLHLFPFLVHFTYLTFTYHIFGAEEKRQIVSSGEIGFLVGDYYLIFLFASILIYNVFALQQLYVYRKGLKNEYSSLDKINLSWMSFVLYGFLTKWVFDIWLIISRLSPDVSETIPLFLSRFTLFLFLNIMFFKGLKQHQVFSGIEEKAMGKKKKSLSDKVKREYLETLENYMVEEKPFLDAELSLKTLSEKLSIPPRSLSEVINENYNNFYDFINHYRILESKKLLAEETSQGKTIQEIYYQVGYNNKVSFNTAFKKSTGMTPSEYKNKSLALN